MARIDPHSYTDVAQGTVSHVDFSLEVRFDEKRLEGTAALRLAAASGGGDLDLDTRGLEIQGVAAEDGRPLEWSLAPAESFMGSRMTVRLPAGVRTLTVRYRTAPDASALQWLEPVQTAGGRQPYLFSQCQPIHARSMAPLQDSPVVRFTYTAELTVPEGLQAVMAARPGQARPGREPGTAVFRFEMPQPIPAYLFALAVGDIASRDLGPRSRVYTEPALVDAASYEFGEVDTMLRAAEELFGPYRWERFDFLVMPPSFPYGGMENPRLTFLTPTLLAGDRSLVNVLTHELAHSWTGNLVTNATMNDFWLNEGFTVWAERRILERLGGEGALALSAAIGRNGLDADIARFGADSPLTRLENDLSGTDPDDIYSLVPYEKGFLFVALLERTAGRAAFDRFIREYIEEFAFTSLTTARFEEFLERKLPGLRAKVEAEKWIRGPGVPETAPVFHSAALDHARRLATGWAWGLRPDIAETRSWPADIWQIFLQGLPRTLSRDECAWLDQKLALGKSANAEILCNYLVIAAGSAYEPAYDGIAAFLGRVGRMKYLKPLYIALHRNPMTRELARSTFAANAGSYHPIARAGLERMLAG